MFALTLGSIRTAVTPMPSSTSTGPSHLDIVAEHDSVRLAGWAQTGDWYVRAEVGGNPWSATRTLVALALDPSSRVRARVASNWATPDAVVNELAADPDPEVREAAATNPRLAPAPLLRLVDSDEPPPDRAILRWATSTPHAVPERVLAALLSSSDPAIRQRAVTAIHRLL